MPCDVGTGAVVECGRELVCLSAVRRATVFDLRLNAKCGEIAVEVAVGGGNSAHFVCEQARAYACACVWV